MTSNVSGEPDAVLMRVPPYLQWVWSRQGGGCRSDLACAQVLIFDFDVHCGNGTVDIFVEDPNVLVIDMHERDVWPHTGDVRNVGHGEGRGATIDIPLPGWGACGHHVTPVHCLPFFGQHSELRSM